MSNLGLERALASSGIRMTRTPVGDKYVLEEMVQLDAALGGEQSGHVIFREFATTGDGMLTALRVFEIAKLAGKGLDELTADLEVYPQRLVNVRVREKKGSTGTARGGRRNPPRGRGLRRRRPRAGALLRHRTAGPRDGGGARSGAGGKLQRKYSGSDPAGGGGVVGRFPRYASLCFT